MLSFLKKNKSKQINSICQAPFKSLRFEPLGIMFTCCYNIQAVAGKYPEKSILQTWNRTDLDVLRDKLNNLILSYGFRLHVDQVNRDAYFDDYKYITSNDRRYFGGSKALTATWFLEVTKDW